MEEKYLEPTPTIDCDSEAIIEKANDLTDQIEDPAEMAIELFYFVRDEIKYNPYVPHGTLEDNKASKTLERGEGYCVQKVILLAALSRAVDIPARLRFADIRNHIMPEKLEKLMGTNLFVYHGYDELYLQDEWIQATPAFDLGMCEEYGIKPVEFDGESHAKFHLRNQKGELHIEYVEDHGTYADLPFEAMMEARREAYSEEYAKIDELMREGEPSD